MVAVQSIASWQSENYASRIQSRDPEALRILYREAYPRMYRFAMSYCGNPDRAAEAVQQAFVEFIEKPHQWNPALGTALVYLLGMTRNRLRSKRRWMDAEPLEDHNVADDVDLLEGMDRNQRIEAVRTAIESLPEHYREIVLLCEIEEFSYEEAAQAVAIPVGTVRSRLARGKSMLPGKVDGQPGGRITIMKLEELLREYSSHSFLAAALPFRMQLKPQSKAKETPKAERWHWNVAIAAALFLVVAGITAWRQLPKEIPVAAQVIAKGRMSQAADQGPALGPAERVGASSQTMAKTHENRLEKPSAAAKVRVAKSAARRPTTSSGRLLKPVIFRGHIRCR